MTERLGRPLEPVVVGPRTKGLRLRGETAGDGLMIGTATIDDGPFGLPLLTLQTGALDHNVAVMARAVREAGEAAGAPGSVEHAPHVKTHMSAQIFSRQLAAGAWGATVATPNQLRVVRDWGTRRVLLANELTDPDEITWVRDDLERDEDAELWLYVDSVQGLTMLSRGLAGAGTDVRARLGVLVEVGVTDGRTGVRSRADALGLARAVRTSGLTLRGVAGYEGSVAGESTPETREQVADYLRGLRDVAEQLVAEGLVEGGDVVVSAGGSAFVDVVLQVLPGAFPAGGPAAGHTPRVVVRSGSYVVHDHGHYAHLDAFSRVPGAEPLHAAATVWGSVVSVPEPGLVLVGLGRRDVPYDLDLPRALWLRSRADDGRTLGAPLELARATVTDLNDEHLYLRIDPDAPTLAPETTHVRPGDVMGFGISHPCTLFDKWRVAIVVDGDRPLGLVQLDF